MNIKRVHHQIKQQQIKKQVISMCISFAILNQFKIMLSISFGHYGQYGQSNRFGASAQLAPVRFGPVGKEPWRWRLESPRTVKIVSEACRVSAIRDARFKAVFLTRPTAPWHTK